MSGAARARKPRQNMRLLSSHEARSLVIRLLAAHPRRRTSSGKNTTSEVEQLSVLAASAVRAVLWPLSSHGTQPVYVTRLLHAASRLLKPWALTAASAGSLGVQPKSASSAPSGTAASAANDVIVELVRASLDDLEIIGDIVRLPGGRWLPAPMRVVPLAAMGRWMLVGGVPTRCLPNALQKLIRATAAVRIVAQDPVSVNVSLPTQALAEWCGMPTQDLMTWAAQVVAQTAVGAFDQTDSRLRFYAPGTKGDPGCLSRLQYYRWTDKTSILPDGRYLARYRSSPGLTHYEVAELKLGRIVALGALDIREGDIRRLMYGIDALAAWPTSIKVSARPSAWTFTLNSELPAPEQRLLTAVGRLSVPEDGRYYPRLWRVPAQYAKQVLYAFQQLRVTIEHVDRL